MSNKGGYRKGAGRHTIYEKPVKRVQVYLDEQSQERARTIGRGNLSAGLRAAVAVAWAATRQERREENE